MVDNSALQLLGETLALTVYFDTENQWLYADWQGAYEATIAQQSAQLLMKCVQTYPGQRLLNNTQHVRSGWEGQEAWAGETLFPALASLGIRYVACVYSEQWQARYSLDITVGYAAEPFIVSFDDLATAYTWLQQVS